MTPSAPVVLNGIARTILMELAPQIGAGYDGQTLQLTGALAMMLAQEFDRAAARLVEENSALEALLTDAQTVVADAEIAAVVAARSTSLLVSALHARNRELRGALLRVHAAVEELAGAAARQLEARIWSELSESTRRRVLDMAMPS
ncbi:MAG: hypothetical protein ABI629_25485 [bacterium]